MTRLFVDLDVLADFEAGAEEALGMARGAFVDLHGERVLWRWLSAVPGFFDRLRWTADGPALWSFLAARPVPPIVIATLPGWGDGDRRRWCARELGDGVVVITTAAIDRAKYAVAGDVLVSGRAGDRLDWVTAGGAFVLHEGAAPTLAVLEAEA